MNQDNEPEQDAKTDENIDVVLHTEFEAGADVHEQWAQLEPSVDWSSVHEVEQRH